MTSSFEHRASESDSRAPDDVREEEDGAASPAPSDDAARGREPGREDRGVCELCGGPTYERHCKIVCLNCGYRRDCSDP